MLTTLRDSEAYQMLQEASEHQVQTYLSNLLSPDEIQTQDDVTRLLQTVGEMRGLRQPHRFLLLTIDRLTAEVKQEQLAADAVKAKEQSQDHETSV